MEGKEVMRAKPYAAQYGAGTAFVLRLSEPWNGSGRYIVAESSFSWVQTAQAVLERG